MSRLEKVVFIFLAGSLFFSENTGKAFLYSCCLFCGLEQKLEQRRFFLALSGISVIFDIHHSVFAGLSLFSILSVAIVVERFNTVLSNLPTWVKLYYLFLIVCGAELLSCLFIVLINGKLNFYAHFLIVIKSIFFCYVFESLGEHAKRF
jgi:hypothetical protein